jgi:hypothetical protein
MVSQQPSSERHICRHVDKGQPLDPIRCHVNPVHTPILPSKRPHGVVLIKLSS